jgi:TolB-like protein
MNIKKIGSIIAVTAITALSGCHAWESKPNSGMWESGTTSSAGWKTNLGRSALKKITVHEAACTTLPCHDADYIESAYNAVSNLLATARPDINGDDSFDSHRPVICASTVNLNGYEKTTNFGRVIGESMATSLTQHWRNKVIKMTLRENNVPIIPENGEFLLSREIRDLAKKFDAGAVMVSSYSTAIDKVYINVELINVDQNAVVAATMYAIPLGPRTESLLKNFEFADEASDVLNWGGSTAAASLTSHSTIRR